MNNPQTLQILATGNENLDPQYDPNDDFQIFSVGNCYVAKNDKQNMADEDSGEGEIEESEDEENLGQVNTNMKILDEEPPSYGVPARKKRKSKNFIQANIREAKMKRQNERDNQEQLARPIAPIGNKAVAEMLKV